MVGIRDVAKKAGVSISTVSRALTNSSYVDEKKKEAIFEAVKELGYTPNLAARSLKHGCSKLIGLIIPDILNPFYPLAVSCFEEEANANGYSIILCNSGNSIIKEKGYIDSLRHMAVDGIIYMSVEEKADYIASIVGQLPIVVVNRTFDIAVPCININNKDATYQAVNYLLKQGHKDIAIYVDNKKRQYNSGRLEGSIKALKEHGIKQQEKYLETGIVDTEDAYERTLRLMKRPDRPTAIFVFNDVMAIGVYKALKKLNIVIPDDVSVIGFDDIQLGGFLDPPITTMHYPMDKIAKRAIGCIKKQFDTGEYNNRLRYIYKCILIERQSVKPKKGKKHGNKNKVQ